MKNFEIYRDAQDLARYVMGELEKFIKPGVSERDIKNQAEILMIKSGSDSFWYHGVGALVHVGKRTLVSQNGRDYRAQREVMVGEKDIVTVDLAPTIDTSWGDYSRTFFVENGEVFLDETKITDENFKAAITCELELHHFLKKVAKPEMTFEELYYLANDKIVDLGCANLDYSHNLGHSVEIFEGDRKNIEKDNKLPLGDVNGFTFEPHIRLGDMSFGVKREDIYYFEEEVLVCL